MNIKLIDVDSKIPNLALMQISAWHKQQGDTVDEIFMMWIAETPATDESGQCTLGGAL